MDKPDAGVDKLCGAKGISCQELFGRAKRGGWQYKQAAGLGGQEGGGGEKQVGRVGQVCQAEKQVGWASRTAKIH